MRSCPACAFVMAGIVALAILSMLLGLQALKGVL